jgi:hypothetical protein
MVRAAAYARSLLGGLSLEGREITEGVEYGDAVAGNPH